MTTAVVVDDSQFMRTVIGDILEDGGIDVVGQASNGARAVEVVRQKKPDLVTMDVEMPRMNGIDAVEKIMRTTPTPILMVSAYTKSGAQETFEALDRGAVDFLEKPGGEVSMTISDMKDQLLEKAKAVAGATVTATETVPAEPETTTKFSYGKVENPTLILGASTGGPTALERVLSKIPLDAGLRILIVQHMPASFTGSFAERLDSKCQYSIREAQDGDEIEAGEGLLAPGGYHMAVAGYRNGKIRVKLNQDPPMHGVRPAIDVTMETAANVINDHVVAVVMTGMGNDGADGIKAIKDIGGHTIAQNEATCVVFGIPARAIETGCVDEVLPDRRISDAILKAVSEGGR